MIVLHCAPNGIDQCLREVDWKRRLFLVLTQRTERERERTELHKFIILKGQWHYRNHKAGGYPASSPVSIPLLVTIKWNMLSGLIVNDTELHSIDNIEFLKVLQEQAITALYQMQSEISFCCNGNVTTDIFPERQNDNTMI